ncbi:hypothetical protein TNCV_1418011 [Trichonephila clavipes]|nr:hypothetical protein TNCV_1418011 [Trichonephila clavipes]
MSPSEQEEDERGQMPTSSIKDLLKKWEAVRAMVLEWHPNQADVSLAANSRSDFQIWRLIQDLATKRLSYNPKVKTPMGIRDSKKITHFKMNSAMKKE